MTLERLEFWSFQCHEHFRVDFDPHCTVFVGSSDSGKSSILRCLRWLSTNRPAGTAFIRKGAKNCRAVLHLDGNRVVRERGDENYYVLGPGNGEGKFKAFGNEVPQSIADLLNVSDVNFQLQHDAPFWLSLTPGQAAKELNVVFSLDLIDHALSNAGTIVRKATASVEVSKERLQTARARRKELAWVPSMVSDLERVESRFIAAQESQEMARRLAVLTEAWKSLEEASVTAVSRADAAESVVQKAGEAAEAERRAEELGTLVQQWQQLEKVRCEERTNGERIQRELSKVKTCPLCGTAIRS